MVKLSRYILVLTGVLVAAVSIPSLYWLVVAKVPPSPVIFYSTVLNDFIIVNSSRMEERSTRIDSEGNQYDQAGYERVLPNGCLAGERMRKRFFHRPSHFCGCGCIRPPGGAGRE